MLYATFAFLLENKQPSFFSGDRGPRWSNTKNDSFITSKSNRICLWLTHLCCRRISFASDWWWERSVTSKPLSLIKERLVPLISLPDTYCRSPGTASQTPFRRCFVLCISINMHFLIITGGHFSNSSFAGAVVINVSAGVTQAYQCSRWKTENSQRFESPRMLFTEQKLF